MTVRDDPLLVVVKETGAQSEVEVSIGNLVGTSVVSEVDVASSVTHRPRIPRKRALRMGVIVKVWVTTDPLGLLWHTISKIGRLKTGRHFVGELEVFRQSVVEDIHDGGEVVHPLVFTVGRVDVELQGSAVDLNGTAINLLGVTLVTTNEV